MAKKEPLVTYYRNSLDQLIELTGTANPSQIVDTNLSVKQLERNLTLKRVAQFVVMPVGIALAFLGAQDLSNMMQYTQYIDLINPRAGANLWPFVETVAASAAIPLGPIAAAVAMRRRDWLNMAEKKIEVMRSYRQQNPTSQVGSTSPSTVSSGL